MHALRETARAARSFELHPVGTARVLGHRDAIRAYQSAIRLQPRTAGFHAALGHAYQAAGDRNRARQAFRQALQIDPNNQAATRGLAAIGG